MRHPITTSTLLFFLLLTAACGYFSSGTWEDDPKNWKRAWGYAKPAEVVMPHSWYWRSPHWSLEEAYFFQFHWHEELFTQVIEMNGMRLVEQTESDPRYCRDKPGWFAPPSAAGYEIWWCTPPVDCRLFRERETKELFFYACQL